MNLDTYLNLALDAAEKASKAILKEKENLKILSKEDGTALTSADIASNEILSEMLSKSDFKILSEEKILSYEERKNLEYFWLIDPLDGTKGFIKGQDEYCIMISLIHQKRPILALIKSPEKDEIFYAHKESKVYKNSNPLQKNEAFFKENQYTALLSINHLCKEDEEFAIKYKLKALNISSGLKFSALLEGKAGIYRRKENLNIWDIAAGDFLLNQNGGFMGKFDNNLLSYNEQNLRADYFIAVSKKEFLQDFDY